MRGVIWPSSVDQVLDHFYSDYRLCPRFLNDTTPPFASFPQGLPYLIFFGPKTTGNGSLKIKTLA